MLTVAIMLEFQSEHQRAAMIQLIHHCIVSCCVIFFFLTEVYKRVLAGMTVRNGFKLQL